MGDAEGEWIITVELLNLKTGQFLYFNGLKSDINFTGIYIVKDKHPNGRCDIKPLAFAFDTRKDYNRVLESEGLQYDFMSPEAPILHIADEETVYRMRNDISFEGAWPVIRHEYLPFNVHTKDGSEMRLLKCLSLNSQENGVPVTLIEPLMDLERMYLFGNIDKRHLLLATHLDESPLLSDKGKRYLPPASHLKENPLRAMKKRRFME